MIDLSQEACEKRLNEELRFVTELADSVWNQEVWGLTQLDREHFYPDERKPCNTVACLAGWAGIHAGLVMPGLEPVPVLEPGDRPEYYLEITHTGQEMILFAGLQRDVEREPLYDISQDFFALGAILFGLECREHAVSLFRSNHTLGSMWAMASTLTEGRVSLPDDLVNRVASIDIARYEGPPMIFQFGAARACCSNPMPTTRGRCANCGMANQPVINPMLKSACCGNPTPILDEDHDGSPIIKCASCGARN